jgi:hypothetical protein
MEIALAVGVVALFLQLTPYVPTAYRALVYAADVRNWSWRVWFWMNVLVLLGLLGLRYGRDIMGSAVEERKTRGPDRAAIERARKVKESRELRDRIELGRNRRIY